MSSAGGKIFTSIHSFLFDQTMTKYRILLGAMSLGMCLSTPWFYGNLFTYEYSYFRYRFGEGSDVYTQVVWIYPVYFAVLVLGLLSVDFIKRLTSLRVTLIISLILEVMGMFLSYFAVQHSIWATMLTFSLIYASGQGIRLALSYVYANQWLGQHVGLSTGLVLSSNGLGGIFYNVIITTFTNPENLKPASADGNLSFFVDQRINERFPKLFLLIGGTAAVFQLIGLVFIEGLCDTSTPAEEKLTLNKATIKPENASTSRPSSDYKSMSETRGPAKHILERRSEESTSRGNQDVRDGREVSHNEANAATTQDQTSSELAKMYRSPKQVLQSIQFYTIWLSMFAMGLSYLTISNSYKLLSQVAIHDDNFLVLVGSVNSIAVIFCRLGIGLIIDRFGVFNTVVALLSTNCVCLSFWFFVIQPNRWLFLIWTSFLIGIQSTLFNVFPVALLKSFGSKYYVTNIALLMTSFILSSLALPSMMSYLEMAVGWMWFFQLISGVGVLSLLAFVVQQLLHPTIPMLD